MKKRIGRTNAFLLEIMLDLIIFAVLLTVCLHMIMKAHSLTNQTTELYEAVEICESLTDLFETGDGTFQQLKDCYPTADVTANEFDLYLNKDFEPVESYVADAVYHVSATYKDASNFNGNSAKITFYNDKNNIIHKTTACFYKGVGK